MTHLYVVMSSPQINNQYEETYIYAFFSTLYKTSPAHNIRHHLYININDRALDLTRSYTILSVVLDPNSSVIPYINQLRRHASYKLKLLRNIGNLLKERAAEIHGYSNW